MGLFLPSFPIGPNRSSPVSSRISTEWQRVRGPVSALPAIEAFDRSKAIASIEHWLQPTQKKLLGDGISASPYRDIVENTLAAASWNTVKGMRELASPIDEHIDMMCALLTCLDGRIKGLRILDLGCGSPDDSQEPYSGWRPVLAETLSRLGANVVGIDYRPYPNAPYQHHTIDISRNPEAAIKLFKDESSNQKFDLLIASNLKYWGFKLKESQKDYRSHDRKTAELLMPFANDIFQDSILSITDVFESPQEIYQPKTRVYGTPILCARGPDFKILPLRFG